MYLKNLLVDEPTGEHGRVSQKTIVRRFLLGLRILKLFDNQVDSLDTILYRGIARSQSWYLLGCSACEKHTKNQEDNGILGSSYHGHDTMMGWTSVITRTISRTLR